MKQGGNTEERRDEAQERAVERKREGKVAD